MNLRSFAGGLKIGIGTGLQSHRDDLSDVRTLLTCSAVNGSIWLEGALDAAVVVEDKIGILPMSTEFDPGPVIISRAEGE